MSRSDQVPGYYQGCHKVRLPVLLTNLRSRACLLKAAAQRLWTAYVAQQLSMTDWISEYYSKLFQMLVTEVCCKNITMRWILNMLQRDWCVELFGPKEAADIMNALTEQALSKRMPTFSALLQRTVGKG